MKNSGCHLTHSCDIGASDFTIRVEGNNQSPDVLQGSETGTNVTLGFGSYSVTQDYPSYSYRTEYSDDCEGVIHPGETKECIVTNTYYNPNPGGG